MQVHIPDESLYLAGTIEPDGEGVKFVPGANFDTKAKKFRNYLCGLGVQNRSDQDVYIKLVSRSVSDVPCCEEATIPKRKQNADGSYTHYAQWVFLANTSDTLEIAYGPDATNLTPHPQSGVEDLSNRVEISGSATTSYSVASHTGANIVHVSAYSRGELSIENRSDATFWLHWDTGGNVRLDPGSNPPTIPSGCPGFCVSQEQTLPTAGTHFVIAPCGGSSTTLMTTAEGGTIMSLPYALRGQEVVVGAEPPSYTITVNNHALTSVTVWRAFDPGNTFELAPGEFRRFTFDSNDVQWGVQWDAGDDPKILVKRPCTGGG